MDNDVVFVCRKCEHHLFINGNRIMHILKKLNKYHCPNCGEEGEMNWIFSHVGNFELEKDDYNWK